MGRLNAKWGDFWQRGQVWYHFWQDGVLMGGGGDAPIVVYLLGSGL